MSKHLALMTLTILAATWLTGSVVQADEEAEKAAVAAAETWLALIDRGDFEKSWETTAALFKGKVSREQWVQTISAARQPFGKLISR